MRHSPLIKLSLLIAGSFLFSGLLGAPAFAVTGSEQIIDYTEPDGNVVSAKVVGDENFNWVESTDDYVIGKGQDKNWYLVESISGKEKVLGNTRYKDRFKNRGLAIARDKIRSSDIRKEWKKYKNSRAKGSGLQLSSGLQISNQIISFSDAAFSSATNVPIIFLLVEFNDRSRTYPASDFANQLQDMNTFFNTVSNGRGITLAATESYSTENGNDGAVNDGVVGWLALNRNHPNTGANTTSIVWTIAKEAIEAADTYVDYSAYDINSDDYVDSNELSVVVVLAGYERAYSSDSPSVWGHKSAISVNPPNWQVDGVNVGKSNGGAGGYAMFGEIHQNHFATIGIMAHELGHLAYALPDLYDTDGSSDGISIYGLMGAGSWGARRSGGEDAGQTPVPPSAWSRYILGWVDDVHPIGTTDIYNAAHASATEANTIIRASSISDPDEYFLAEVKRPTGYNEGLERWLGSNYSGGVMIWHVDDSQTDNTDDTHRWVDVEWADGDQNNFSNDFWLNGGNTGFTISSTPNSLLYSFADSGVEIYVNSSAADIMSVTFGPPNTTPTVTISTPADNANFTDSDVIAFTGSASDAEDGDLSAGIEWSSDIDGVLGSGASVNTTLTAGTHTISATVTDSGTLVDIDNITIYSYGDSDADGMNDLWEINYFGSIAAEDGAGDFDGDGLSNLDEFNLGTTPTDTDTDSDGVSDGDEVALYNIDPLQSNTGDIGPLGSPDGQINAGDLVVMIRLLTGLESTTALESVLADINGDGQLNVADLLLLQKAVLAGTAP